MKKITHVLTGEIAKRIMRADHPPLDYLKLFYPEDESIDPDSIPNILQLWKYDSLEPAAAEILSEYEGDLIFSGLKEIDDESAQNLRWHSNRLILQNVSRFSDAVAGSLADHESLVRIDVVESLKNCRGHFALLHRLFEWSDEWRGNLGGRFYTEVKHFTPTTAGMWAGAMFRHRYGGVVCHAQTLSSDVAKVFIGYGGDFFRADNLDSLSERTAKILGASKTRQISLGVKSISPKVAEALASFKGDHLWLPRLKKVSIESRERLQEFKGVLHLPD